MRTGFGGVPYYWAGVFVLEVARFMYPQQHFGLVDNDCVPVTLFEAFPKFVELPLLGFGCLFYGKLDQELWLPPMPVVLKL